MEFKTASGLIKTGEILCDSGAELVLESQYSVPDYQSEIFRIVHTDVKPVFLSKTAVGERAVAEGYAEVNVIYTGPDSDKLCSAVFKIPFTKQFELARAVGAQYDILCECKNIYLTAHAVTSRKLQARGSMQISVKVLSYDESELICDIGGCGAQQLKRSVSCFYKQGHSERQFGVNQTLRFEKGSDSAQILFSHADVKVHSVALDDGHAAVRGALYLTVAADVTENGEQLQVVRNGYEIPFDQVVLADDMDADDGIVRASASCVSLQVENVGSGMLEMNASVRVELSCYRMETAELVEDFFSTLCDSETESREISLCPTLRVVDEDVTLKATRAVAAGSALIDARLSFCEVAKDEDGTAVRGIFSCLLRQKDGSITEEHIPARLPVDISVDGLAKLNCCFRQCEANVTAGELTLSAAGSISGEVIERQTVTVLVCATAAADSEKPQSPFAVSVYYTEKATDVWSIAKQFSASVDAINAENARLGNCVNETGFIIIPRGQREELANE